MRIALNAHLLSFAASYRQAGISRLIHGLIYGLQEVDDQNEYDVLVGDRWVPADYVRKARWRVQVSRLPTANPALRILWEQTVLPWLLVRSGADLLHALAFVGPVVRLRPTVVTVYDLSFLLYPAAFHRLNRWYLSAMTPLSVRRARRVIAISESTRSDLVRLTGVPADRIEVVYPGLEPGMGRVSDPDALAQFRRRHGLPDRCILSVGTLEPRKNAETLVRAYAALRAKGAIPHALVLVGARGWRYESVFKAIEESGYAQDIIVPGYVAHEELPFWYSIAELFVYPSLYEGFGLPVLEAMACGVPVITSDVSSLPEVAGDAAVLVQPSREALADAISRVARDATLRAEMSEGGLKRAQSFTWERAARQTMDVYRKAVC